MFGGDDDDGLLGGILGGSESIDEDEIWSEVRVNGKHLKSRSENLRSKVNTLRDTESAQIAEPQEVAEHAEEAAEHALDAANGAQVALNTHRETAIEGDEQYDILGSVQEKVEGLADNLTEAHETVLEYGEETYEEFKEVLEADVGLNIEVNLPDNYDWDNSFQMTQAFSDVQTEYKNLARTYRREANSSQKEKEKAEERADQYREIKEDMEGSMFEEEYGQLAEKLEEKAENDEPVTPAEKAEKAETYAAIAEFAKDHLSDVADAVGQISKAREEAYTVSDHLSTLMKDAGYSLENDAREWQKPA